MKRVGWVAVAFVGLAALAADTIPLAEIEPGMTGYGLTVVGGTEISRFEVEVVAVLDEPGERDDFIIVRAFGPAIARSGGVAQGMSGSPIYLDGRLAGALSRATAWSADRERPLALVTPIEAMLKVLDEIAPPKTQPIPYDGPRAETSDPLEGSAILSAPVMASGLSARALEALNQGVDLRARWHPLADLLPTWRNGVPGLRSLGVSRVVAAPAAPGDASPLGLEPGAPVGVGLATGDITIGALGTVTLVEGKAVLAFGHPFLFTGPARYFLTQAHVFDTVAALDFSYKLGTVGEVVGGVFADRSAGVGGVIGRIPSGLSASFRIRDLGRAEDEVLTVELVDEPQLSALLLYVAGLEAADRALDRIGPGTATLNYTLTGRGLPRPLTRENVFLSTADIAPYVSWEMALIADVLAYNEFADPGLLTATLEATVRPELSATEIVALETDRDAYAPGDRVQFIVTLRGWRGEVEEREGWVEIPADAAPPYVELRAYGGPRPREKGEPAPALASLGELLDYIEGIPTYDTLTIELFALDPISNVIGEAWLYGVDGAADRIPGSVVYGTVSVILPLQPTEGE
ncbi:MAG: SpoIVB peptidase S55 domain-containing protein [Candidatus Bipolaricaulis anaerobius]|nr:SpoIVB peptidase S55 domain-containing protein [Candidatus Bipolaricaulis anaerobius]